MALVGALLGLPVDTRYGALDISPQQRKAKTLTALSRNLVLGSETLPVVVVFEDVHWIDPTTEEFLQQMIGEIEAARMLLIVTHRPEYQAVWSTRHGYWTTLSLSRLGKQYAHELANAVSGGQLSPSLMERVVARTDGIPLFIEELANSLLESHKQNTTIEDVPISLQASLDCRIDRLGAAKEIAQVGAVLGRELTFSFRLLAELMGGSDAHLEEWCHRLVQTGLASQHGMLCQCWAGKS